MNILLLELDILRDTATQTAAFPSLARSIIVAYTIVKVNRS